jgi:hypothetical protein
MIEKQAALPAETLNTSEREIENLAMILSRW